MTSIDTIARMGMPLQEAKRAKTLDDIPLRRVWQMQAAANARMQLFVVGQTHARLGTLSKAMRVTLLNAARSDGKIDGLGMYGAMTSMAREWAAFWVAWKRMFVTLRREAASVPAGVVVVYQRQMVAPAVEKGRMAIPASLDAGTLRPYTESGPGPWGIDEQVQEVLDAAQQRIYDDGLNLSQRLWKMDKASLEGIRGTLAAGVANGDSAWNIATQMEQYLGAGADCPRWTSTRLNSSKADIAGGTKGLFSGTECRGQGVAYNALRLARNELQTIHAMATDKMMARMPWVEKAKVNLSPGHGEQDKCDAVIAAGEGGRGIYPKGTILLPLHVQCMCYLTAEQMPADEFAKRMKGWVNQPAGTAQGRWSAMDDYATWIGGIESRLEKTIGDALAKWLFALEKELKAVIGG